MRLYSRLTGVHVPEISPVSWVTEAGEITAGCHEVSTCFLCAYP